MKAAAAAILLLALSIPAQARPHWYSSKKFWVSFGVSAAAMAIDYKTSQDLFARGGVETNPIFGAARPSAGRMTAIGLPINFAWSYAGYRMSESRHPVLRKLWVLPSAYQTEEHLRLAIHNAELCLRGCAAPPSRGAKP